MSEKTKEEIEKLDRQQELGGFAGWGGSYDFLTEDIVEEAVVINRYLDTPRSHTGLSFGEGLPTFTIDRNGREFFVDGEYIGYGTTAADFTRDGAFAIYDEFCDGGME